MASRESVEKCCHSEGCLSKGTLRLGKSHADTQV